MSSSTAMKLPPKIAFKNVHAQSVPAFGVMQVTGSVVENGVTLLICTQPGSTLGTEYAINGPSQVSSGAKGVCYREGAIRVAFDGGSPAAGEGWGVRANQWTLSSGYPAVLTVHGVQNVANKILFGELTPVKSVLGAVSTDLAPMTGGNPGQGTASVYAWDGAAFSPATPTMSFFGTNVSQGTIKAGVLTQFVASHGLWVATPAVNSLTRFELTQNLVFGVDPGSDNAKVVEYSSGVYAATGATIRVFDWTRSGTFGNWNGLGPNPSRGIAGYHGLAIKSTDSGHYEIVWMEMPARFIGFRLAQRLKTSDASQASCPVVVFADGRDPDPFQIGVTVANLATDFSGIYKFAGEANAMGYAFWNAATGQYQICALEGDGRQWVLFRNDSGEQVPANALMAEAGVAVIANGHVNGRPALTIAKPSVTFKRSYWVNGYAAVASAAVGVCCSTESPVEFAFESTGPGANGETWGPKPGQWTAAKGFPGLTATGVTDATNHLALGCQEAIVQLLGKTTGSVSANSSTTSYRIYVGTAGSEADGGWTSVPSAYSRSGDIDSGAWILLQWLNGGWEISPLVSNGGGVVLFKASLTHDLASTNSTAQVGSLVSLTSASAPSGVTSAANTHKLAGLNGDSVTLVQDTSSSPATYYVLQVDHHVVSVITDSLMTGNDLQKKARNLVGMPNEVQGAATTVITGTTC